MTFREFVDLGSTLVQAGWLRPASLTPAEPKPRLHWKAHALSIAEATAIEHGVTLDELKRATRRPHIAVVARHEAWLRIYEAMQLSDASIGLVFMVPESTILSGRHAAKRRRAKAAGR